MLQIHVTNVLPDQPIDNYYMVEAEGTVNLGPAYGTVRVVGMTIEEITKAIDQKLGQILSKPEVSVQLARVSGTQHYGPVSGRARRHHQPAAVRPGARGGHDGDEARVAIQKHLSQFLDSPELSVDVVAYNSKTYYVITQGAAVGDNVRRLPSPATRRCWTPSPR